MFGLDLKIINDIEPESVIAHVKEDVRSDFILAPHYDIVYNYAGEYLWEQLRQRLRAGQYQPDLPITISVPKERFFTRPGSILCPVDRFVYQAIVDSVKDQLEDSLDRERAFSHVPLDSQERMFEPNHVSWGRFQTHIFQICDESQYVLKADISHYFERLPQHHLVNLMVATGCAPEIVSLLEKMMLAFRESNSFGIIQGVYPSDVLGNFFLSDFDAYCEIANIPSARYVDDIYMGFESEAMAIQGLGSLIETLRKDGLHLNEYKSKIIAADDVRREETVIDRLFDEIRTEVEDNESYSRVSTYGFGAEWGEDGRDDAENEDGRQGLGNTAIVRLIENIDDYSDYEDQIEKFCLPFLRAVASGNAIEHVLNRLQKKPHQTRLYFSYISVFVDSDQHVAAELENLMSNATVSDYQKMFLLATLLRAQKIKRETVNIALHWLLSPHIAKEARAMAAIFVGRHGSAQQKRAVRTSYESEQSSYVRSAILYSTKYFPPAERRTCRRAWGGHSWTNTLIAEAIQQPSG